MGSLFSKSSNDQYKIMPDDMSNVEIRLHITDLETDIKEEEENSSDVIALAYLFSVI